MPPDFASIDDYIKAQPADRQARLQEMRQLILDCVPAASELINYNIPAIALVAGAKRDAQVMFAGFARHVGFYPGPSAIAACSDQLQGFRYAKGSVQFPNRQPLPVELVRSLIDYRLKELKAAGRC